ncbi:flagellin N-terminal helical domain-containing protein [Cytobacillus sp. NCCP-133]|uniref:flagellin N-terminal helical domain-containing protein n=1 Tax=Cytobacillus sp. NCCP-133 TaxID=766848 RepID=UPI002813952A|nr:flagellin [Cytobacillus sp. NCCP-133]GLB60188.1 hypothetical protein NCCP133_23200 [Cytobacillus sp. NCCP-133]
MIINNNIPALNTYRQMGANNAQGAKAMEKLSSGLRINRAGDDAAGLAISEKMRAQVRGLDQASRNSQDGISMIQTAEGALQETHNILQRMRELATQASNDTNVEVDRKEIQKEMNALTSEINRIGNTTEFNTQKLLNGGGEVNEVAVNERLAGAQAGSISAMSTITGSVAEQAGEATLAVTWDAAIAANDTITVDGEVFTIVASGADASLGQVNKGANATDLANSLGAAIAANDKLSERYSVDTTTTAGSVILTEKTGQATGNATTLSNTLTGAGDIGTTQGTASIAEVRGAYEYKIEDAFQAVGSTITIGGETFTAVADGANASDGQFNIGTNPEEQAISLAAAINANSALGTRFDATVDGDTIRLTEKIGEATGNTGTGADVVGNAVLANNTAISGQYAFDVTEVAVGGKYTIDGVDIKVTDKLNDPGLADGTAMLKSDSLEQQTLNLKNAIESNSDLKDKYNVTISGSRMYLEQKAGEESIEGPEISTNNFGKDNFQATFQVGSNSGQGMTIEIDDMRSKALKISGDEASATIKASNGSEASFVAIANVTNGTDSANTEFALDVSSNEKAQAAISVINDAIETISSQRSNLGAFQNRLEHTISNLSNSSENLQAAESRIRDVDMAKEVMEMTRANILGQASQAMLAQANQKPQSVLQLLG